MEDKKLETVQLEKMNFYVNQMCSNEMIGGRTEIDVVKQFSEHMCLRLKHEVYGKEVGWIHISYPENWWEALKQKFLPEWAKERWPVKYKVHDIHLASLFPTFPIEDEYKSVQHYDCIESTQEDIPSSRYDHLEYEGEKMEGYFNEGN